MAPFTLRQCAYFDAVAEHGGIAQAARALSISQPAVAQGIDKLEQLTGLVLFERHHARGTDLTLQGRAFRASVRPLLATADNVAREAEAIAAERVGTLRLGCFHTLAPFCVAPLVRHFAEQRPGIALETSEGRHDELLAALAAGLLDTAVLYDMGVLVAGVKVSRLARFKPAVLLPAGHRLGRRRKLRLTELAHEPFVQFDGPGSSAYFRGVLASGGIDPPVAMHCQSAESVRSAVGNGVGFSLVVMRPASRLSYDGQDVVTIDIADAIATLDVVLATSELHASSALVAEAAAACTRVFAQDSSASRRSPAMR